MTQTDTLRSELNAMLTTSLALKNNLRAIQLANVSDAYTAWRAALDRAYEVEEQATYAIRLLDRAMSREA